MPTGSCGRFLFGRFATPSARTKPPGRAAQKLVRRPNKRTRQCALESIDLRTAPPASELRAEPSTTSTPRPPPHEAGPSRRARHARRARGAASSTSPRRHRRRLPPPPEPSRVWPRARADATPSPHHVAAISTHTRAAALRRSPRSTTERCPIRRSTHPRAAAAPRANALSTIRRASAPPFVDADDEGGPELLRVPDVHGRRRARLAPQRPSGRMTGRSGRC